MELLEIVVIEGLFTLDSRKMGLSTVLGHLDSHSNSTGCS